MSTLHDPNINAGDPKGSLGSSSMVLVTAAAAFAGVILLGLIDQDTAITSWTFLFRAVAVFGLAIVIMRLGEIVAVRRQIARIGERIRQDDQAYDEVLASLRQHEGLEELGKEDRDGRHRP